MGILNNTLQWISVVWSDETLRYSPGLPSGYVVNLHILQYIVLIVCEYSDVCWCIWRILYVWVVRSCNPVLFLDRNLKSIHITYCLMSFPMTQWRYIGELSVTSASSEDTMYSGVHVCIVHISLWRAILWLFSSCDECLSNIQCTGKFCVTKNHLHMCGFVCM